eukprot:855591-Alexandrium_andersonii.AAC.1
MCTPVAVFVGRHAGPPSCRRTPFARAPLPDWRHLALGATPAGTWAGQGLGEETVCLLYTSPSPRD